MQILLLSLTGLSVVLLIQYEVWQCVEIAIAQAPLLQPLQSLLDRTHPSVRC